MKYYKQYLLKKATHKLAKGTVLTWQPFDSTYCSLGESYSGKPKSQVFTMDDVQNSEWFDPSGTEYEFYRPAPDELSEHFDLVPELRHNEICDFCRAYSTLSVESQVRAAVGEVLHRHYEAWRKSSTSQ